MQRRDWIVGIAAAAWGWREAMANALSQADASAGVRAALERGSVAAVSLLGKSDGFLGNPKVRIGLPPSLDGAVKLLRATGQGGRIDELVTAMNRAAEAAVPEAQPLLLSAARSIGFEDVLAILRGGDTSVTDYFARKTREPLGLKFLPIVSRETAKLSLAEKYDALAGKAAAFGLVKREDANIERYVTAKALDGLYLIVGEEEKKIRADPISTGSALLKKVFGG
jgi:hypothetical protein